MADPAHIAEPIYATTNPSEISLKVLLPATATGGSVSLFEEITPPGNGPPLHVHYNADEFFRVLTGQFLFRVGTETFEAGPGDTLFVPRGEPHCFYNNGTTPGRLFMGFTPGGAERVFEWLNENGFPKPSQRDELKAKFGIEYLGRNPFAD